MVTGKGQDMGQMRVGQVDMSTGEMLEGAQLAVVYPKRRNGFVDGWVAMAQGPMKALAKADLGDEARRVMFAILGELDFENWININQAGLATEIGLHRQHFGRGLKKLLAEGVVIAGPKVGRNNTYRLNPQYGWKGSAKGHQEALLDRMKARGLSVIEGSSTPEPERDIKTPDMFDHEA
jgi:DNA-binding transcriptional ArsR family regulator